MNRVVTFTPVELSEADVFTPKKTPLTELVRTSGRQMNSRSAHMTLDVMRAKLVDTDSLDEFEATSNNRGIFGWLERRRKATLNAPATRDDGVSILTAATVFASSRR